MPRFLVFYPVLEGVASWPGLGYFGNWAGGGGRPARAPRGHSYSGTTENGIFGRSGRGFASEKGHGNTPGGGSRKIQKKG